jgi:hypothetical protein
MSYLGYANPFYHLSHIILFVDIWLHRHSCLMPSDFYIIGHYLWHDADPNDTVGTPVG